MRRSAVVFTLLLAACSNNAAPTDPRPSLDGSYVASIPPSAFKGTDLHKSLAGEWRLEIRGSDYELFGPGFRIQEELQVTSGETLVISALPAPGGAFNCHDGAGRRLTPPAEVEATYSYTSDGPELDLSAEDEPCQARQVLLQHVWDEK